MNLVRIQRTPAIERILQSALDVLADPMSNVYKQIENSLQSTTTTYIPASLIVDAHRITNEKIYLHEILAGCDLYVPSYVAPERNPELHERVERLKVEQANREYEQMTRNVDLNRFPSRKTDSSFLPDMKSVQGQLITVFNVFLTIIGAFTFGYKAVEYSLGVKDFTLQVSCGLFCALVVAVADLYFLFKRLNQSE
jgi:TMEM199 family protein